ncbi:glycosyltransferase family 2 protein [Sporocytophaga myxococcoides]|uniref:glycosyltransferase family 2 protein n=1 Tax=Sporocytophaga myxococcoides TaxID=153721 RepID=UPI000400738C|nr:glycosyltransferase family 2 protein [Sporocytophaga myxococcoides]
MSLPEIDLSIILPCYNEGKNIPHIIKLFKEALKDRHNIEVILVNNGSTDNSSEVLIEEFNKVNDPRIRSVKVDVNKGYGLGILSGLNAAKGNVLAWTHADLQTDPIDVIIAYEKFKQINDSKAFVKGKRKNRAWGPAFFTYMMQLIASAELGVKLVDIGAQPKVFSKDFYTTYLKDKAPYDFSLDLYAQYFATRYGTIYEIPVVFKTRKFGEAKGGGSLKTRIKVSIRTFKYIRELKRKLNIN